MSADVQIRSPRGELTYEDSGDHFENGFCRLLGLRRDDLEAWLAMAEASTAPTLLDRLQSGFAQLRPAPGRDVDGFSHQTRFSADMSGAVLHPALAENPAYGVAVNAARDFGWLVEPAQNGTAFQRVVDPPVYYDEGYFEGNPAVSGGYGSLTAQSPWRMEKAARQVRELCEMTGITQGKILDVGSGYGYFRNALGMAGFAHEGVEISAHARTMAKSLFGFDTRGGTLHEHVDDMRAQFAAITLWDVLEHVADPWELLSEVASCLVPGGFAVIKTPNLDCPEADVFGSYYHSFKREHLVYFTPTSLARVAEQAGLRVHRILTISHLLVGLVGRAQTAAWENALRGADIVAYLARPG